MNNKQVFYSLIFSLGLIKLEILKTYIKTNLANRLISYFQLLIDILIVFAKTKNRKFYFHSDY